jgi:hypothetical protein
MTPSALSYLAYAVSNGFIRYTAEVADTLGRLEAADRCREACPYGYDIPTLLRSFMEEKQDQIEH